MKNVIITGSTGMIGRLILENCLKRDDVGNVTTIVRRKTGIEHAKLREVVLDDFFDYSRIVDCLKSQDVCFFCIGVYTGAVSKNEFRTITVDYTIAFAETLRLYNQKTTFCFLSGQGADLTGKSRLMFSKDKGVAEKKLIELNFHQLCLFRPGYIYPVTPRKEPGFSYRIMRLLYKPLISRLSTGISINSEQLAQAMVETGMKGGKKVIYENKDIRDIPL
jgi:uncharacterized protein YbjT (DUF2867 family)